MGTVNRNILDGRIFYIKIPLDRYTEMEAL
jgi:hypothetical protein